MDGGVPGSQVCGIIKELTYTNKNINKISLGRTTSWLARSWRAPPQLRKAKETKQSRIICTTLEWRRVRSQENEGHEDQTEVHLSYVYINTHT